MRVNSVITKETFFDFSQILSTKMYEDLSGEFVCRYWREKLDDGDFLGINGYHG